MNHQDHGLFRYEQTKTIQKIKLLLEFQTNQYTFILLQHIRNHSRLLSRLRNIAHERLKQRKEFVGMYRQLKLISLNFCIYGNRNNALRSY